MLRASLSLLLGSLFLCPAPNFANPPEKVGEYGDLKHLVIRGSKEFSEDQIRRGLQWDLDLLPVTRASSDFTEFCNKLRSELTDAYRRLGFLNVDVVVGWDEVSRSPIVTIDEGACFRWGKVVINGVEDDLQKTILNWVTQPHPPIDVIYGSTKSAAEIGQWTTVSGQPAQLQDPVWEAGKRVNSLDAYPQVVQQFVARALQDHGYHKTKSQIEIEPDQNGQTASLIINVTDLGTVAVIERVVISGNKRDTTEEILKRIEIKSGDSCTAETLLKAQQGLRNSGRFRWSSVKLAPQLIPTDPVEVLIELVEYDQAPPLSEELGEVDRVACRTAEWLTHLPEHEYDLILTFSTQSRDSSDKLEPEYQTIVAVSPTSGFLIRLTGPDFLRGGKESLLIAMSQNTIDLVLDRSKQRFHLPLSESASLFWSVELEGTRDTNPENASKINFKFAAGINSSEVSRPTNIIVSPMSMMYLFKKSNRSQFHDELLTLNGPATFGKVDITTGRPIELRDEKTDSDGEIETLAVRTERGGLDRLRREWLDAVPIMFDGSNRPVSTFGEFLMHSFDATLIDNSPQARRFALCSKLVTQMAGRLDPLIRKHFQNSDSPAMLIGTNYRGGNSMLATVFTYALPIQDFLFARETRPWKFGRELAAYAVHDDPQAKYELNELMESAEAGPLTHLYMAAWLSQLAPPLAESVAKQGLQRLDYRYLHNDLQEWLNEDGIVGDLLIGCARDLRKLSGDDLAVLFYGLPEAELRDLKSALADDKVSDFEITMQILKLLWDHGGGRELIRDTLQIVASASLPQTALK